MYQSRSSSGLPNDWPRSVRSATLRVIALAQFSLARARGWAAKQSKTRVRLSAELDRLQQEIALLREESRLKDARLARLAPLRRPHYTPMERLAILELRAARGWSLAQTARAFLVTTATIAEWTRRVDEGGPNSLVQMAQPVNKFPDFVRYIVQRLKPLCPTMGKLKMAQTLARAGLHLGTTTVGRMLREKPRRRPVLVAQPADPSRAVTARRPNHVWHVDLTVVPTGAGFRAPWLPFSLPQCWPFCWWIAVVVDHFSRCVLGLATFRTQPTSRCVRPFLGRTIRAVQATPKYLICDRGRQFDCCGFRTWCGRHSIRARYGAIGRQGSIAVVERCIRTLKDSCTRRLLVSLRQDSFRRELLLFVDWYNQCRPHTTLGGRTPDEAYQSNFPTGRRPRYEPRSRWPRGSPCAKPWALIRGRPGAELELEVTYVAGRKHLPIVTLRRAA